jgi:hypothetical protein
MAHPLTIPMIGGLALMGAGLGLYLGNAAISEINPLYFSERPARFHSDLTPNGGLRLGGPAPLSARADIQDLGSSCIGCRDYPEEYYPIHDASVDGYDSGFAVAEPKVELAAYQPEPVEEVLRLRADIERVERYARGSDAEMPAGASTPEAPATTADLDLAQPASD